MAEREKAETKTSRKVATITLDSTKSKRLSMVLLEYASAARR